MRQKALQVLSTIIKVIAAAFFILMGIVIFVHLWELLPKSRSYFVCGFEDESSYEYDSSLFIDKERAVFIFENVRVEGDGVEVTENKISATHRDEGMNSKIDYVFDRISKRLDVYSQKINKDKPSTDILANEETKLSLKCEQTEKFF